MISTPPENSRCSKAFWEIFIYLPLFAYHGLGLGWESSPSLQRHVFCLSGKLDDHANV